MFLKMSPEKRMEVNDDAIGTVFELEITTERKKKTAADIVTMIEGLIKGDIKFINVSGLVAVVQGAPVTKMDLDIVHQPSFDNSSRLFDFLRYIDTRN